MLFNHLYPKTDVCPISGQPISFDFILPANLSPYGFTYKVPTINPDVIVIISNDIMTDRQEMNRLSTHQERFINELANYKDSVFRINTENSATLY